MALQCDYIEQEAGESNRRDCDVPAFISKLLSGWACNVTLHRLKLIFFGEQSKV